ncbi:Membrane-anchored ribosome-binding protein, inhibits growth in stationary phase, ElaB/YqjD/DUF883 family [Marinobacter daqiaonensis]|uniref:Membrane-anchored ribosome-binding protein, inhibits growth in stationary phase, ElaB/YqjD/DUF883 family n=1 Tax=Marinobacter daqiaonensis TaxID=650891 RepID=A0A1I6HTP1_9GAMM|nr:DUF883 family protein [Marinobacter daqiaonensis]SFR57768.1 Membrane-anchored ribosome-binding protein, inhibits growth in stationary phase, ElaB/YqjD/DUF883 family [Marinobacter daqiaonensis]
MEAKAQKDDYEQVKADLKALREDLAKLSKSVADGQKSNITSFRDEIRRESQEALERARKRGDEYLDYAKASGEKAVQDVEHRIEERPFLTVIIMFLAGLVVGKLLDR